MTAERIEDRIAAIVRETLGAPDAPVTEATTARDIPGWDSVKMVEIILRTEEEFGITLRSREVDSLRSVGDLVRIVAGRLAT